MIIAVKTTIIIDQFFYHNCLDDNCLDDNCPDHLFLDQTACPTSGSAGDRGEQGCGAGRG